MARPTGPYPSAATSGWTIARFAGIPLTVDASYLLWIVLLSLLLKQNFVTSYLHDSGEPARWALAIGLTLSMSACVVAHELAHSAIARAYGLTVRGITLFVLGGVSQIERGARTPAAEYSIAIAGPLASVVIAAVLGGVERTLNPNVDRFRSPWGFLAGVNIVLALFNLVPAFPMDGGRVLRSILWFVRGDRAAATRVAALVGRGFAVVMIAFGVLLVLTSVSRRGGLFGGVLWTMLGFFIYNAASSAEHADDESPGEGDERVP